MGLPETVSPAGGNLQPSSSHKSPFLTDPLSSSASRPKLFQNNKKKAVIVLPKSTAPTSLGPSLGHQYVLGIFPLTSVYLEHSAQTELTEVALSKLQEEQYEVTLVEEPALPSVVALFSPQLIIQPTINTLDVNAYDLLFVRLLKVEANLTTQLYWRHASSRQNTTTYKMRTQELSHSEKLYRRYAFAPSLAFLLQKTLKQTLQNSFQASPKTQGSSTQTITFPLGDLPPLLLLPAPTLTFPIPPRFGELLASSYGFDNAFSQGQVIRLAQRGLKYGLSVPTLGIVETQQALPSIPQFLALPVYELSSAIAGLTLAPDENPQTLNLTIDFEFRELRPDQPTIRLRASRCTIEERRTSGVDGYWVRTFENTLARAIQGFMNNAEDLCSSRFLI